ncbi:MAG: deoxyhypusine synthase [Methermicoccaceae archaeon]
MSEPVIPVSIEPHMTVDSLLKNSISCGFGLGRLAYASDVLYEMVSSNSTVFLGLAGAMVPAGMKKVVNKLVREGCVDVLVSTGANLVHDLIESLGGHHFKGSSEVDDIELRREGISRIYDVYLPDEYFDTLEHWIQNAFGEIEKKSPLSISELLAELGSRIDDKESILRTCYEEGIPVFCPAIQDSVIGLQAWLFNQTGNLVIDALKDMHNIIDIAYEAEHSGALLVGGGVPKNFILQSMLVTPKAFDYVVQLTMDRPEPGGLSGATLEEAQSWGKVSEGAMTAIVYSDATITFPLLATSLLTRLSGRR